MSVWKGVLLVCSIALASCTPDVSPVMDRDTFIGIVTELREAERLATDEADFEVRKATILTEAGVTDSLLVEFTRYHGTDASFMAAVWDSVDRALNTVDTDDLEGPEEAHIP